MSTQTGTFTIGTFGFPITVTLGANLTGATSVSLHLTKPSGEVVTRDLGLAAITDAVSGAVTYSPTQTDVDEAGEYSFSLTIAFAGRNLVSDAQFYIEENEENAGAFVVENGTGLANANSYASVEEANTYHEGHLYPEAWRTTTLARKQTALIMATRLLDASTYYYGTPARMGTSGQALGWPRRPGSVDSAWGNPVTIAQQTSSYWPSNQVPKGIKDATCELALELLRNDRTLEDPSRGIASLGVGQGAVAITFKPEDRRKLLTDVVHLLVKPFGVPAAGGDRVVNMRRV